MASTNSAALAGAAEMPDTTRAAQKVATYSSQSNGMNSSTMLLNVTATPSYLCLNTVSSSLNVACQTASGRYRRL